MAAIKNPLEELVQELAAFTHDPLGFVLWNYPWGHGELKDFTGPDAWQVDVLNTIGEELRAGAMTVQEAVQFAIASGHGIGKSALVAWIIDWAMSTFEDTRGVVTANTETQLRTKTWPELAKWHRLGLTRYLFKMTATARYSLDPAHEKTWRVDMVPWSENNPEAFAGLHNKGKRILVIFDEASSIHDMIWETTSGALTDSDTEIIWLVCGNPTKSTGRFRECFAGGSQAHRWITREIDSRSVKITNKRLFAEWIDDWGLDSDFVRVRVLGQFPRIGMLEFISRAAVMEAQQREVSTAIFDPVLLGVDVARFGDDKSCIYPRKGRDARSLKYRTFMGLDTMALADEVMRANDEFEADAVFIDGGGIGAGVVDRCRQLGLSVFDVQFGARAARNDADGARYANKRADMWGALRADIPRMALPADQALLEELCAPEYGINDRGEIQLEKKEVMKKRGVGSPDIADALALTYAYPVVGKARKFEPKIVGADYDPFAADAA